MSPYQRADFDGLVMPDRHEIIAKAHRERAQALRQFLAWLFHRPQTETKQPRGVAPVSVVARGSAR
jgi:hypothetical protein